MKQHIAIAALGLLAACTNKTAEADAKIRAYKEAVMACNASIDEVLKSLPEPPLPEPRGPTEADRAMARGLQALAAFAAHNRAVDAAYDSTPACKEWQARKPKVEEDACKAILGLAGSEITGEQRQWFVANCAGWGKL